MDPQGTLIGYRFRFASSLFGIAFILLSLAILLLPSYFVQLLNLLGTEITPDAPSAENGTFLWIALSFAAFSTQGLLCFFAGTLRRLSGYFLVLLLSSAASFSGLSYVYLRKEPSFAVLALICIYGSFILFLLWSASRLIFAQKKFEYKKPETAENERKP